MGKFKLPGLLTADWNIGSGQFSDQVFSELVASVKHEKVKDVLICGNILEGLVRRSEQSDLIDLAAGYLKQIPSRTKISMISGVNEETMKKRSGYDALRILAERIPNATYYGKVAKLKLGNRFSLMAMHGRGKNSYASLFPVQKAYAKLRAKPNILVMGHFREMLHTIVPHGHLLIEPGTLAMEPIYVPRRGVVGWYILREYDEEHYKITERHPKVY